MKALLPATGESLDQLRAIFDHVPAAMYLKDLGGHYVVVNRRCGLLAGGGADAFLGRTDVEVFGPEAGAQLAAHDGQVLGSLHPLEFEETLEFAGESRLMRTLRFPVLDDRGQARAVGGICLDLTEQQHDRTEQQHDRTEQQHDRTERLHLAAELRKAQRLESLGQIVGGVVHDFNNLLSVILNYGDFVLCDLPEEPPADWSGYRAKLTSDLTTILDAARASAAMTRQLLLVGRGEDPIGPTDLKPVVAGLEPLLRSVAGDAVALELSVAEDLLPAWMDPHRFQQVLLNLAANAHDAMDHGGTLSISLQKVDAAVAPELKAANPGGPQDWIRVTVADTGCGMPPEVAAQALQAFYTTKAKGRGTGLGLATVQAVVTEAGGHLRLTSAVGDGTTVELFLPAGAAPMTPASRDREVEAPEVGSETILLVDDDEGVCRAAARILEQAGYEVLAAVHPSEALRLASEHGAGIEVLVTDLVMPDLGGPDLARAVRAIHPDLPVVYLSGYPNQEGDANDDEHGPALLKPFTATDLLGRVRRALDRAGPRAGPGR